MDFENNQEHDNARQPESTQPQPQTPPVSNIPDFSGAVYDPYPKKKGSGWKVFFSIILVLSILANGVLLLGIIGLGTVAIGSSASKDNGINEKTVRDGDRTNKIAIINIEGIIDGEMSDWVRKQVKSAEDDASVKGLILRINSPGGAVSSSDQIHHYICRFKKQTQKPVLAFMQSVAASGGYYSAVACDEIMAEPTAITGSIGVIMNHLVLKQLLEEKLGINPVTLKSGEKKDWPSMFNETTDEEKQYLHDRLIDPAYDRFVELVARGRQNVLDPEQIKSLADGSIYTAQQALDEKLIDAIGYLEEAIYKIEQMAQVSNAKVVTYEELFTFWSIMGAQSKTSFSLDAEILEELAAPKLLYLWDGKQ